MIERLPEAGAAARRFHEHYDRLYPRVGVNAAWEDTSPGYRHRLTTVFNSMLLEGTITAGPQLGIELQLDLQPDVQP